jgi:hypothetical protein
MGKIIGEYTTFDEQLLDGLPAEEFCGKLF